MCNSLILRGTLIDTVWKFREKYRTDWLLSHHSILRRHREAVLPHFWINEGSSLAMT